MTETRWRRVPKRVRRVVEAIAAESADADHYRDASTYSLEVNVSGELEQVHHPKGGFWNDRSDRAGHGITLAEVAIARRELRRIGVRLTRDEADALLMQAVEGVRDMRTDATIPPDGPAERKRRQRARLREAGLCITCPVGRANVPEPGRTTCAACNAERLERMRCSAPTRALLN